MSRPPHRRLSHDRPAPRDRRRPADHQPRRHQPRHHQPRDRDLRGFWRRALAILVPVPMLALVVGLVVMPFPVGGNSGSDRRRGGQSGPGPGGPVVSVIFALTVAPATMAVAWTGRRGAPWLTLAAGVSLLVAFGAGLPNTELAVVTAATHGLDPALVTAIDRAVTGHPAPASGPRYSC